MNARQRWKQTDISDRPDTYERIPTASPDALWHVGVWAAVDAWCPIVGPSAMLAWQYLACAEQPVIEHAHLAATLGLNVKIAWHAVDRLERFGLVEWLPRGKLLVSVAVGHPQIAGAA